jgi:ribonuclease HII
MVTLKRDTKFKKNHYEMTFWDEQKFVCGIDEVGRGCLAGPVVAAAVIIHTRKISRLVSDSKVMTPEEREKAYGWICKNSFFGIGIANHRLIDRINIYRATLVAMQRAVMQLFAATAVRPSVILVDAMPLQIPSFNNDIIAFPFGETKSTSIAAASIVAKVTRDHLMQTFETVFPGYSLGQHKGYSTPFHKERVKELQRSIIHRTSFIEWISEGQLSLMDELKNDETVW